MLKQKIVIFVSLTIGLVLLSPVMAHAATEVTCPDGQKVEVARNDETLRKKACTDHQSGTSAKDSTEESESAANIAKIEPQPDAAFAGCDKDITTDDSEDNQSACGIIGKYVNPLINFLAALVGMVVTIMIMIGGIQYASAGADPGKINAAKNKIINALIALVAFLFLYAILQWLVPGGFL